ncbi:hypothetical protein AWB78_08384 [Caballeronia calidae]|uniref:Uncharacterized protein n=1 Tax=Caballeronia calidae TaxID=1777139 RepID=A0A158EJK3_9BURK|nr:hypothetical protein AWB78_08384 [Caballeronia calidae]
MSCELIYDTSKLTYNESKVSLKIVVSYVMN